MIERVVVVDRPGKAGAAVEMALPGSREAPQAAEAEAWPFDYRLINTFSALRSYIAPVLPATMTESVSHRPFHGAYITCADRLIHIPPSNL